MTMAAEQISLGGRAPRRKLLFIFGTRPEAIKVARVIHYLREHDAADVDVCVTGQHRQMLDQVLRVFDLVPQFDLDVMVPGQTLAEATGRMLMALDRVLAVSRPDLVMVQGDTLSTFCGALAGFYADIPVGHVEAGLRTGDIRQPFPEEMNRVLAGRLTSLHFAATDLARRNLLAEGVQPDRIHVTGNTGIDAVLYIKQQLQSGRLRGGQWDFLDPSKRLLLVTAHRRESFGAGFERLCRALQRLAQLPDVELVYPVHLNPNVRKPVQHYLAGWPNIHLIEPLDYVEFVDLMRRAHLILTDSGGIQEEAPSFGKPVLVLRDKTERPEAVMTGTSTLVGTDPDRIVAAARALLEDDAEYHRRSRIYNPYGDGHASERIARAIMPAITSAPAIAAE
jgi:UDP-N-acetylglucosamine 2-epimerase (non-hydrolysing)